MLLIAIVVLVLGASYAVYLAPSDQKAVVGAVLVVLAVAGYFAGVALTEKGTDQRTYYPIAGAIGGAMIAFGWISQRQKSWPKKDEKS
jgi:peptidoglycan/LPS O-acetylase OafA/YrhL